uniref:Lipocalin family protein n=1 Tax=Roseihalotalea indica TaxID=2867963 RepID=A0AA49JDQ0_9BACT|nr:lipocalin family protein [Tunicatimonas sp. TK19036]
MSKHIIYFLLIALLACQSQEKYGHLIGDWEVVKIEASGERVPLELVLDNREFRFTNRGAFQQGDELTPGIEGSWRIKGDRLQMSQPEIRDLNGRVISRPHTQEWELTLSPEWMIWRGTALNQSHHLKVELHKVISDDQQAM